MKSSMTWGKINPRAASRENTFAIKRIDSLKEGGALQSRILMATSLGNS